MCTLLFKKQIVASLIINNKLYFVLPAGVSARSLQHCFTLCSSVFNLQTATPGVRKHTLQHTQLMFTLQCPVIPNYATFPVLLYLCFFLFNRGSPLTLSVWMTAQPDGCKSSTSHPTPARPSWSQSMV